MPKFNDVLKNAPKLQKREVPFWKGPLIDGVTCSLLHKFLECRERFRLKTMEGLTKKEGWDHKLSYGNMWHVCEEAFANSGNPIVQLPWQKSLENYCRQEIKKYPMASNDIEHWYNVCLVQFPEYINYWKSHPENSNKTNLFQEKAFNILYTLPSGDQITLRGKWDSIDIVEKEGIYLQENKTKGQVNEQSIYKQLSFDMQTMLYLVALKKFQLGSGEKELGTHLIKGVRYNVIRRPLSGGKGTIRQTKKETKQEYYNRLAQYIKDEPEHYFMRWKVLITEQDIENFRLKFLDPILQQLVLWYNEVNSWYEKGQPGSVFSQTTTHYQAPYGTFNSVAAGYETIYDNYLATGSELGLDQVTTLYPELEEEL